MIKKYAYAILMIVFLTSNIAMSIEMEDLPKHIKNMSIDELTRYQIYSTIKANNKPDFMERFANRFNDLPNYKKEKLLTTVFDNLSKEIGKGFKDFGRNLDNALTNAINKTTDRFTDAGKEFADAGTGFVRQVGDTIRSYGSDQLATNGLWLIGGGAAFIALGHFAKKTWDEQIKVWYRPTLALEKGKGNQQSQVKVILNKQAESSVAEALAVLSIKNQLKPNILFYGPPGTGKTLKARQIAYTQGFDFIIMSGSAWFNMPTDLAIENMDTLFRTIQNPKKGWFTKTAPVMVFIDEADALLNNRNDLTPEQSKIVTHFLTKTGDLNENYFFVFATNRANIIDDAMISRITYSVRFDLPEQNTRKELLTHYFEKATHFHKQRKQFNREIKNNMSHWSELTQGLSGRDIKQISDRLKWKLISLKGRHFDLNQFIENTINDFKKKQSGTLENDIKPSSRNKSPIATRTLAT